MKRKVLFLLFTVLSIPVFAQTGEDTSDLQIYVSDHIRDCDSEGFIRVVHPATGKVGMLDADDQLAIPTEYSDLTPVRNGLIYALKGASKVYTADGEHFHWEGGEVLLINTRNQVLARNVDPYPELNLFSLEISDLPSTDPLRYNIEAVDGRFYSFVDFDREFRNWLHTGLLSNLSKESFLQMVHPKVSYWSEEDGWVFENQLSFVEKSFDYIQGRLKGLEDPSNRFTVFTESLNPEIFSADEYTNYFNDCGEFKTWLYPVKVVHIRHDPDNDMRQDQYDFLRTPEGYKLIGVSMNP